MPRYLVDSAASRLRVQARSKIHDTSTTFSRIGGEVQADPAALTGAATAARFTVAMAEFDAGDWLKNRKLKGDLQLDRWPEASFELRELRDVVEADGGFTATAVGLLRYRGRELEIAIAGRGRIDAQRIEATGRFDLDIRQIGMEPPKILMFKVDPEVTVDIELIARAS